MDSNSKQRLAGVMVIIALATIVLPIVFHHRNETELALSIPEDAPPPPPLPQIRFAPEPSIASNTEAAPSTTTATKQIAAATPVAAATPAQIVAENNTPKTSDADIVAANTADETTITSTPVIATNDITTNEPAAAPVPTATKVANTTAVYKKTIAKNQTDAITEHKAQPTKIAAKVSHKTVAAHHNSWVVQLGSFKNHGNANKLVGKLRKNGFTAFTELAAKTKGAPTRVCIGPEFQKQKADQIVKDLANKLNIKGIVVRHHV